LKSTDRKTDRGAVQIAVLFQGYPTCAFHSIDLNETRQMLTAIHNIARRKVSWIFLLAILAAYFRIVAVVDAPIRSDAAEYYMSAYDLVHNGVYSRSLGELATPPVAVNPTPIGYRGSRSSLLPSWGHGPIIPSS
jgi:hypothetical protein